MAATKLRDAVLAAARQVTAEYADKAAPLEGIVCGNTEIAAEVYDAEHTEEVELDDGSIETVTFRASVADYLRTIAGEQVAAVNWTVEGGEVRRVSFLESGSETIDNYDGSRWSSSNQWEV